MFLPDDGIVMFFEAGDPDKTKSPPGIQSFRDEPMTRGATRFNPGLLQASPGSLFYGASERKSFARECCRGAAFRDGTFSLRRRLSDRNAHCVRVS